MTGVCCELIKPEDNPCQNIADRLNVLQHNLNKALKLILPLHSVSRLRNVKSHYNSILYDICIHFHVTRHFEVFLTHEQGYFKQDEERAICVLLIMLGVRSNMGWTKSFWQQHFSKC